MGKAAVLIIDPFSTGNLYAQEFKEKGYDVYALISSKDISPFYLASFKSQDFVEVFDDETSCIAKIKDLKLVSVVSGCETGVYLAEKLGTELNFMNNHSSTTQLRRDKYAMQLSLKEAGLNYIETTLIHSKNDVAKIEVLNFDEYIVKPVNSAGTESVTYCMSKNDVYSAIAKFPWNKPNITGALNNSLLVQQFIEGDEYVIDMVAFQENIVVTAICKYEKIKNNTGNVLYYGLDILDPYAKENKELIDYAIKASKALSFKQGPIHMELIMSKNGPVMIEVAARLHGGIAPLLFKHCYTPSLLELSVSSYLNEIAPKNIYSKKMKFGRIIFLIAKEEGEMNILIKDNEAQLKMFSSYQGHAFFYKTGDKINKTLDLLTCPGIVWLASDNEEQIKHDELIIRPKLENNFVRNTENVFS